MNKRNKVIDTAVTGTHLPTVILYGIVYRRERIREDGDSGGLGIAALCRCWVVARDHFHIHPFLVLARAPTIAAGGGRVV